MNNKLYDLVLFFYNSLYEEVYNSLSLFPFLSFEIQQGFTLLDLLSTFIVLGILIVFLMVVIGIFTYIFKMIRGLLSWESFLLLF